MKKTLDRVAENIIQQIAPAQNASRAGHAGAGASTGTAASNARVIDGKVKREWLMGDPWTDNYYFKNTNEP